MTEQTTTDTTTDETPQETPEQVQDTNAEQQAPEDTQDAPEDGKAGREAAKYRRQLRDTEAERDSLREQVQALQRAAVEQVAARQIAKPAALWTAGVELADVLGDDGAPDPAKIKAACAEASARLGLQRPLGNYVPNEGRNPHTGKARPGFADAFGPGH